MISGETGLGKDVRDVREEARRYFLKLMSIYISFEPRHAPPTLHQANYTSVDTKSADLSGSA